jgi:hypothetical protein
MKELEKLARTDLITATYTECHRWMLRFLDSGAMYPPENDPLDEFSLDNYSHEDVADLFIHRNYMICQEKLGDSVFNKYIEQHLDNMNEEN